LLANSPTEPQPGVQPNSLPANVPFQDPEKARQNLSRIMALMSPALARAFPLLLADAPDTDCALTLFDRLVNEASPQTLRLLERHHELAHYAILVFGHSQFLGETLVHNPDLFASIHDEKSLDRSFSRDEFRERFRQFRSRAVEPETSAVLAGFKRREYVRILLRDVLKIAALAETTTEISALADVLIEAALDDAQARLHGRFGPAQHMDQSGQRHEVPFAVLSLGKLGGNELNYSSDIDLMFVFGDGADAPGASTSHHEYFVRLAQELTGILSRATPQGPVFRIDLRLRPQGAEGELAISLAQSLRYYATTAHDWERQALIKCRHSAGDAALARQLIDAVRPFVYTEEANFAAIKTALVAREKMQKRYRRRFGEQGFGEQNVGIDLKIGTGGIRDIEFLVQCLQRVYGGSEPWLRSSGTLFSLHKLHDNHHLSGSEFHELSSAYEFLRTIEHRLQLRRGQQTHHMPVSGPDLLILQRSIGRFEAARNLPEEFVAVVRHRMALVAEIYRRVIYQQQNLKGPEPEHPEFQLKAVPEFNLADHSNRHIVERLAADAPELRELATGGDLVPAARRNLFRFLSSALTSSERYAAVLRHRAAVARAIDIFGASDYLTEVLIRHPEEIASVADLGDAPSRVGSGYLFESPLGQGRAMDPVFAYLASSAAPYNEKLALLRRQSRHRVFVTGAKDIAQARNVYVSCAEITAAAEDAIAAAFEIADAPPGLAIMGLGRLGAGELDLLSDVDLLFVCEDNRDRARLTRSVSHIVQILAAYTSDGMVFPVDTRLRPRGSEGELLTTPEDLARYFEREAQAWEALTYTKMRFLAGASRLGQPAGAAVDALFQRLVADPNFVQALREMRGKLEAADSEKNLKTSPGGVYDIDFLTGFLLVKNGIRQKNGTLRDRLWRCVDAGLLDKQDAAVLDHAGELLRTVDHLVRLVVGRRQKWLPDTEHAGQVTETLASEILRRQFANGLEAELDHACSVVRKIYERVLGIPPG
jgi:[glutamine synthetase] adenylyltransferase / [glutamine synthetase]-adenylyl-L-tyrosine phosphorylase